MSRGEDVAEAPAKPVHACTVGDTHHPIRESGRGPCLNSRMNAAAVPALPHSWARECINTLVHTLRADYRGACAAIAQLDRASDFESEGWGFKSLWLH
jgi:hypothetical protein